MRLLVLFLVAVAAFGQSFDRLVLRPRSQGGGTYLPAILKFCGSTDWPSVDPECVGIQSPMEVDRYNLYWPIAAPELTSCIAVNPIGQMSFVACGEGIIQLNPADALFPRTAQASWFNRHRTVASIGGASYLELIFDPTERTFWTFSVPPGFSNQPELKVWGQAGGTTDEWEVSIRCVQAGGSWFAPAFDTMNEGTWQSPEASDLNLMVVPLINNDDMESGMLCSLNLLLTASDGRPIVFYAEIY